MTARIVAALGGNALIRRGEPGSVEVQRRNARVAAAALLDLVAAGHRLVVSHGNGPQVGFLAIEAEAARRIVPPPPLDVLGAESEGQIGYLLAEALQAELGARGRDVPVVALLTRTVVDADDPAFARPTKPVGPVYRADVAQRLAREHGWSVARDGRHWRRVVPSPRPRGIVEADTIRVLVDRGVLVIASGGGGIPVVREPGGAFRGVEAVIDKDLAAVELAAVVGADALLLLTDVDAVYSCWPRADAGALAELSIEDAERGVDDGTFAVGSMGPKVAAAAAFVRRTGGVAAIGSLDDALAVLEGRAGTRIVPLATPHTRSTRTPRRPRRTLAA